MSAIIATIAVVVVLLAVIGMNQRRMIYFPDTAAPSLGQAGLADGEAVTFDTADGLRLDAWFFAGSGPAPRPTVLVFNGNAGHRGYRTPLAAALRRQGLNVMLMDYRGYGGNPGAPSEAGLAADARAALAYLVSRPDVDRSRIVYFGESLGAAVAVRLAVEQRPAALILRSPFTSMTDVGRQHYPLLPVRLLLRDRFASIDIASRITAPVLVIAGSRDTIVPIEQSRLLYAAIASPKTMVELPDADHNDEALLAGEEMIQAIVRFVRML